MLVAALWLGKVGCLLHLRDYAAAKEQAVDAIYNLCEDKGGVLEEPAMHLAAAYASLGVGEVSDAIGFLRYATKTFPQEPQPFAALSSILETEGYCREAKAVAAAALARENRLEDGAANKRLPPSQRSQVERRMLESTDEEVAVAAGKATGAEHELAGVPDEESLDQIVCELLQRTASIDSGGLGLQAKVDFKPLKQTREAAEVVVTPRTRRRSTTPKHASPVRSSPRIPRSSLERVRWRTFGPEPSSSPGNDGAVRLAAMKDLEALFSNLMPSPAFRGDRSEAPVAEVAQVSGACCLCRKRAET